MARGLCYHRFSMVAPSSEHSETWVTVTFETPRSFWWGNRNKHPFGNVSKLGGPKTPWLSQQRFCGVFFLCAPIFETHFFFKHFHALQKQSILDVDYAQERLRKYGWINATNPEGYLCDRTLPLCCLLWHVEQETNALTFNLVWGQTFKIFEWLWTHLGQMKRNWAPQKSVQILFLKGYSTGHRCMASTVPICFKLFVWRKNL